MRTRLLPALVLAALPQLLNAQSCNQPRGSTQLLLSAGHVQHASAGRLHGRAFGASLRRQFSGTLAARVQYRREVLPGAGLNSAGVGASLAAFATSLCLTLDVLGSVGSELGNGDAYRNLTVPLGLHFSARGRVVPHAGVQVIMSTTDARLLSYSLRNHTIGYGASAGARLNTGRVETGITLNATTIERAAGPQPLGRFRADLSFGVRL